MGRPWFYRILPWGQELLINDHKGHSYTSGEAGLGLRCQEYRRRASCQLVGRRIIYRRLSQSCSEL
jgi:hypothetical protein